MTLSRALCRPTSSRSAISSPVGVKRPAAWSPPVSSNARWAARSRSGKRQEDLAGHHRAVGDRVGSDRDLVEGGLAADPARRRCDEVPLGDGAGIERARQPDGDPVVGLVHVGRVAGLDPEDLGALDQTLGAEEADGQLVLVAGRPHRDRDRHRLLARTGGAGSRAAPRRRRDRRGTRATRRARRRSGGRDVARRWSGCVSCTDSESRTGRVSRERIIAAYRCRTPCSDPRGARVPRVAARDGDPRDDRAGRPAAARAVCFVVRDRRRGPRHLTPLDEKPKVVADAATSLAPATSPPGRPWPSSSTAGPRTGRSSAGCDLRVERRSSSRPTHPTSTPRAWRRCARSTRSTRRIGSRSARSSGSTSISAPELGRPGASASEVERLARAGGGSGSSSSPRGSRRR